MPGSQRRPTLLQYLAATPPGSEERHHAGTFATKLVYGTIVVLAFLAVTDPGSRSEARLALEVLGIVFALLVADVVAESVGEHVVTGRLPSWQDFRWLVADNVGLLAAAIAPMAVLLAAHFGVVDPPTAYFVDGWACALVLILAGTWVGRLTGQRWATALFVSGGRLFALAAVAVLLKILLGAH